MARYTESFNKADSSTLGPDLTWTEVIGDTQVVSNSVRPVAGTVDGRNRAEHDCATDDNYAQITSVNLQENTGNIVGPICRYDSAADTGYDMRRTGAASLANYTTQIRKTIAGVVTSLGSPATVARATSAATPETLYIGASGSTLTSKINGAVAQTLTDTDITIGKRGGFRVRSNATVANATADDFMAGDLVVQVTGHGAVASAGRADVRASLPVAGRGAVSTAGRADVQRVARVAGRGSASTAGTATLTTSASGNTVALTGSGAASSAGRAAVERTATFASHGDAATTGQTSTERTAFLAGQGTASSTGSAAIQVVCALAAHGANSSSGSAALRTVCVVAGFGAATNTGKVTLDLLLALAGKGNAATDGDGTITASSFLPDPDAITLTLRDRTHTETLEDRWHMVTARER
jgi:hypothetical protein